MIRISLLTLFIVYFRIQKSNQNKSIYQWPFQIPWVFILCFLFIFAVCCLVFEQYLVKWECSLSATAIKEIIFARYPAEISFLILFYWKKSFYLGKKKKKATQHSYTAGTLKLIWNTKGCSPLPRWFMIKMVVTDYL